jgi:hypothetical protein
MIMRCYNPNATGFEHWGGRGIRVCEQWRGEQGFEHFLADMGERPSLGHSLDRFPDKNGDYEPSNVRWATEMEQHRNRRDNRMLEFRGERRCVTEWAEVLGIQKETLQARLMHNWPIERALTEPVHSKRSAA